MILEKVTKKSLTEASLLDKSKEEQDTHAEEVAKSAAALDSEEYVKDTLDKVATVEDKDEIGEILDKALVANENIRDEYDDGDEIDAFVNILLVGEAGVGKTSRVKQWAKRNNIHLVIMLTSTMDQGDFSVMAPNFETMHANKLTTTEFDKLNQPRTVLFLDEYNRADFQIRGALLTLINNHMVPGSQTEEGEDVGNGMKYFENFLFTVCAINPAESGNYNVQKLDAAELGRFARYDILAEPEALKNHLIKQLDKVINKPNIAKQKVDLAKWKKVLVDILLSDPHFAFDNSDDIKRCNKLGVASLNPRSFDMALKATTIPTINEFLTQFEHIAGPHKVEMIKNILSKTHFADLDKINIDDFEEIADQANAAFDSNPGSQVISSATKDDKNINLAEPTPNEILDDEETEEGNFPTNIEQEPAAPVQNQPAQPVRRDLGSTLKDRLRSKDRKAQ